MTTSGTSYQFEIFDGFSVISLQPELNNVPWAEIDSLGTEILEKMAEQKTPAFLVDLDALSYMGSAMVALVVRLWKAAKERKGKIAVVNSDAMVLEVLKLAGLEKVWTIVDTREEGLKSIGASSRQIRSHQASAGGTATSEGATSGAAESTASTSTGGGTGLVVLTLLLVAAAGAGLFLLLFPQDFAKDERISLGLLFGGAVLGLITGAATAVAGSGGKRGIGVLGILAALVIIGSGIVNTPKLKNLFAKEEKAGKTNNTGKTNKKTDSDKSDSKKSGSQKSDPGKTASVKSADGPMGKKTESVKKTNAVKKTETGKKTETPKKTESKKTNTVKKTETKTAPTKKTGSPVKKTPALKKKTPEAKKTTSGKTKKS